MLRPVIVLVCLSLTLSGCGRMAGSSWNPLNWFGGGSSTVSADGTVRPLLPASAGDRIVDSRGMIDQVLQVELARTSSGAILRATGLAAAQGYYNAELVPVSQGNGTLVLEFRIEPPATYTATGSEASRRVTVARDFDIYELAGIRTFTVQAARNSRSARR